MKTLSIIVAVVAFCGTLFAGSVQDPIVLTFEESKTVPGAKVPFSRFDEDVRQTGANTAIWSRR